ncbi:MAG: T9SS type A sorting domain-containing protein [Bacteroidales bacterium]|nr:T9SS type A sorting domain-containing protein [Bacteroidales bacterium]
MKPKLLLTLALTALINFACFSQTFNEPGAGVTIILHGWNPDGSQPSWMQNMANAIVARAGSGSIGTITVTGTSGNLTATCSNWNFDLTTATSGEIVVLVDWTAVSNHLTTGVTAQEVATAIAPKIYESQNSQPALSELPIHLIGHSRGGGMVFEIARLLGLQGIEVEQVTALDPHPLTTNDPQVLNQTIDTPVQVYENVLFTDTYWQNINFPKGEYVNGAYNRLWTDLSGGYHNESGYNYTVLGTNYDFSDHLNIILAYYGTIDLSTPTSNGQATMGNSERAWFNTYENAGENTGFKYSRIIMGDRKSTDTPVTDNDAIIAGYNNNSLLGGNGARQTITWTNAVWCNVITSTILKNSTELSFGTQAISDNDVLQINYKYRSYANASTVTFYVDVDRNPYNNNNAATIGSKSLSATGSTIAESSLDWTISDLTDQSKYYVYSEITDGTRKRYQYSDYELTYNQSTGIISADEQPSYSLYPNPFSDELTIETNGNNTKGNFEILNATGQVVFKGRLEKTTTVQTNKFLPGIYIVKIETGKTFEFKKVVKK